LSEEAEEPQPQRHDEDENDARDETDDHVNGDDHIHDGDLIFLIGLTKLKAEFFQFVSYFIFTKYEKLVRVKYPNFKFRDCEL